MAFILNGVHCELDAGTVRSALRGVTPDAVREHWVDVDGVHWPPKQVFALATGLERTEFTSHTALRQLQRLGLRTSKWGPSGTSPKPAPEPLPEATPASTHHGAEAATSSLRVVLVGCSSSKAPTPRPAAELFTGGAFGKARDLARSSGLPWYVLSAKWGLLDPDEVVAPYDVYLGDRSTEYRTAWGAWVVAQLADRHDLRGAVVEVHAGRTYCDPLAAPLAAAGATLHQPLAGLRQGERLAWYARTPAADDIPLTRDPYVIPDVSWLLDPEHAVAPADFLAAGRANVDRPGLYSWWVDAEGAHALSAALGDLVDPGLVYAGRAGGVRPNGSSSTNTLWGRVAEMHLGGNRSFSTFRLTLAACLSAAAGRVVTEAELSAWMHEHLRVAVLPLEPDEVSAGETELLKVADPPLNLSGVARTPLRQTLSRLRSALKETV
ncbi:DUF6884 domain-containing protein [Geodermatophilus ruber]|uniref:Uncharacterized protein n=1 Tax=Geodermatophilus ruber TaxID=504800 RepID=A0A1I4H7A0_9ACTN|nr:DUF6884 domain-containing protein [Geodermatophilus ruber]SFL38148.1 hypothetical protein SAMN04488085_11070 [Geodermatophilus ruber]